MNSFEYKPSTVVFDERVKTALSKLKRDFSIGHIKTKTEYAYRIKKVITDFYNNVGKPQFKFIPASDVPNFEEYKIMVEQSVNDITELLYGCNNLNETITNISKDMTERVDIVKKSLAILESKLLSIEGDVKERMNEGSKIFNDFFQAGGYTSYIGFNRADTENKNCALYKELTVKENDFDVEILKSSNGFPGNTHEIYVTMSGARYTGESNPRVDLNCVLDKTSNYFDFELYSIEDTTKIKTSSVGFKYKEGVSWISDAKELKLDIKVSLKEPKVLNTMILKGIPKLNYCISQPTITEIIISDGYSKVQNIRYGEELSENTIISFKPQVVNDVIIKIVQKNFVPTKVSRSYKLAVDPTKLDYFSNEDLKDFTQIECPTTSIEVLGLKYDNSDKSIIYPNTASKNNFLNSEYVKSKLFYSDKNLSGNDSIFTDIIDANRYSIALNNISFEYNNYSDTGVYVSESFKSDEAIKKVTLNASHNVPSSFVGKESKYPFIAYYLSFNDEEEWHRVFPRGCHREGHCTIEINSCTSIEERSANIKYIDRLEDVLSVRLKIEMCRPDDIIDETPVVMEYNLEVGGI